MAGAYADRGRAHELKGDRDKAIADYRKALSLKSNQVYDDKAKAAVRKWLAALGVDAGPEAPSPNREAGMKEPSAPDKASP
jgi:tetratricopeptide (TPR) repeat protein